MSYQPFPNDGGAPQPVVQQPGAPFAVAPTKGPRRKGMIVAGVVLLLAGIGGGGALIAVSASSYQEGVENLARAPIGCTTSLDFAEPGTYTVYVETKGEIGEVRGDCESADDSYEWDGRRLPDVELTLLDGDDEEVDLDEDESKDYEIGDYAGSSIYSVEIDNDGRYSLTVSSEDEDFAIAVGKDPKSAAGTTGALGFGALALGLIVGLVVLLLGLRRKKIDGGAAGGGAVPFAGVPGAYQAPAAPAPGYGQAPPAPPAPPAGGFGQPQWPAPPGQ